jgi:Primosomal protein N'' (replication factor Y) - superfamily II helicase
VAVPFGKQKVYTAIVVRIHQVFPQTYEPKPIAMIMDDSPVVTQAQFLFWEWLSSYYMCTKGEVFRACLPAALMLESQTILVKCDATEEQLADLSDTQYIVYEALQKQTLTLDEISQITDLKRVMPLVLDMIEKKTARIHQMLEKKFKPKRIRVVQLAKVYQSEQYLKHVFESLERAPKQRAVLMAILSQGKALDVWHSVASLKENDQVGSSHIKTLIDKGILMESYQETHRILIHQAREEKSTKVLSQAQEQALTGLKQCLTTKGVVLFEGVTSSGKTEVYIR